MLRVGLPDVGLYVRRVVPRRASRGARMMADTVLGRGAAFGHHDCVLWASRLPGAPVGSFWLVGDVWGSLTGGGRAGELRLTRRRCRAGYSGMSREAVFRAPRLATKPSFADILG